MAWLGEGLSNLKGQIQSFTKEVLSEGKEESDGSALPLHLAQQKVEELEALCATQDLEISALKQQNADLQRRLDTGGAASHLVDKGAEGVDNESTWWTVEHRCDMAYNNGSVQGSKPIGQVQNGPSLPNLLEVQEKELKEREQLVEILKAQVETLEADKHKISQICLGLEEQVHQLTVSLEAKEVVQLQEQLQVMTEQLTAARDGGDVEAMREQLVVSQFRIAELEGELQKVQQQLLDHISDSQTSTSDLLGEVEQTRLQLLQESGTQKTQLLRARQDMVNRIIQMGEKSREVEQNMKKLQAEGKHLSADMAAIVHKLGDPEQQELIHGALNALELENQVLKLRNAQLELSGATETLRSVDMSIKSEPHFGDEEIKSASSDLATNSSTYLDVIGFEEDFDTVSNKSSEFSELSQLKQKLGAQVTQLQGQIDVYKRDIKHYEMIKLDWTEEKEVMEKRLFDLREQLRQTEESLTLVTAQKGLLVLKQQSADDGKVELIALKSKNEELSSTVTQIQEEKAELLLSKNCLSGELEAMAKIVQDLESQLARAQDDNTNLSASLEELDRQHQDAIDQMLNVKKSLQTENEKLQLEIIALKQNLESSKKEDELKQDQSKATDRTVTVEVQTSEVSDNRSSNSETIEDSLYEEFKEKYELEFQEKVLKLVTFEIPKEYCSKGKDVTALRVVEGVVKAGTEWKWKKDTLERKVAELMKEGRDTQVIISGLEEECKSLRENMEALMEEVASGKSLASIPEHNEEMEALEQRVVALESEVDVLREARTNLEADAARLREEGQGLVRKLHTTEAMLRNQENLEAEVQRWRVTSDAERQEMEADAKELQRKIGELEAELFALRQDAQHWQEVASSTGTQLQGALQSAASSEAETEELVKRLKESELELHSWQETTGKYEKELQGALQVKSSLVTQVKDLQEKMEGMDELISEHASLQADRIKWKELAHETNVNLQDNIQANIKLKQEVSVLEVTVREFTEKHTALQEQIQEYKSAIKAKNLEIESFETSVNTKVQQLKDTTQKLLQFEKDFELLQNKLCEEAAELKSSQREKSECVQQLHNVSDAKMKLEARSNELQLQLDEREQQLAEVQALSLSRDHERDVMQEARQEAEKWQTAAAKEVEKKVEDALRAKQEVSRLSGLKDELEEKLGEATLSIAGLKQERDTLQSRVIDGDKEIARLSELNVQFEARLILLLSERDDLQSRLALHEEINDETSKLRNEELQNTLQNREKLIAECQRLQTTVTELEVESARWKDVAEDMQQQAQSMTHMMKSKDSDLVDLMERYKALQSESNKLMNANLHIEGEYKRLKESSKMVEHLGERMMGKGDSDMSEKTDIGKDELQLFDKDLNKNKNKNIHSKEEGNILKTLQDQVENLQSEKQSILSVLDEKTRENGLIKVDNNHLLEMISVEKSVVARLNREKIELLNHHHTESKESAEMLKDTMRNLSNIIKEKDLEIESLALKCQSLLDLVEKSPGDSNEGETARVLMQLQGEKEKILRAMVEAEKVATRLQAERDELSRSARDLRELVILLQAEKDELVTVATQSAEIGVRLQGERDELVRTVHVKHQESVQYHTEIQRLNSLLSQELGKSKEIEARCRSLSEELDELKRNSEATRGVDIQELQTSVMAKEETIQRTTKMLEIRDRELQERAGELEALRLQVWTLSQDVVTMQRSAGSAADQLNKGMNQELQKELANLTESLKQERAKSTYLQNEMQERHEKQSALQKELERLRLHLVSVEESYTQETLRAEEQVKELQGRLLASEERIKSSSTAYTSASIRANQQVETMQEQTRLVAQQRDEGQQKLSAAEDQVHRHAAALRNLQAVLEQFQRDKEREIAAASNKVYQQVLSAQAKHEDLLADIASLKVQLSEAKEGLSAAARLGEQLDKKSETVRELREEVTKLRDQLSKAEERVQSASMTVEGKVDRSLVKNIVLGYFLAPPSHRDQVLRIVATVLDFSQEERDRVGLEPNQGHVSQGWFRSLMHPGGPATNQSLSEAFIRFLESESRPQPQLRLLPDVQDSSKARSSTPSPSSSTPSSQRRSPLLLSEVHLPTFGQFPVGRNSSSILKDVLKDS